MAVRTAVSDTGETVSGTGYETDAVVGRYFVINQGTNISNDIANSGDPVPNAEGTVVGREKGNLGSC